MKWTVEHPDRLDVFLSEKTERSRSQVQKDIKDGSVKINGNVMKKASMQLRTGEIVTAVEASPKTEVDTPVPLADLNLNVLYEDDSCLVIYKPKGFAVHPGAGMEDGELTILDGIAHLFEEKKIPYSRDAVLVHRLDKDTTGCLLIAKTTEDHRALQKQFKDRTIQKTYLAIVSGVPDPAEALIDAPIGRNLLNRIKMSILRTSKSREARTSYKTIDSTPVGQGYPCPTGVALLECDLHTGRTHQIRVHLSSIGHPILGDPTYGSSDSQEVSSVHGVQSLCLHAASLSFLSLNSERIDVTAPLPSSFSAVLQNAGLIY